MNPYNDTEIHVLNVGRGSCTIIRHASGRITMIDINNGQKYDAETEKELKALHVLRKSALFEKKMFSNRFGLQFNEKEETSGGIAAELTDPVAYYLKRWPKHPIFRFILTHPDLDHIRGLKRLRDHGISINNFWDTDHEIDKSSLTDADQEDWDTYEELREGRGGAKVHHLVRGSTGSYWSEDNEGGNGDGLTILAPTPALRDAADEAMDPNGHSYVLHLAAHGTNVIFGGDAIKSVLGEIHSHYGDNLSCDVYVAAHHGRDSGYHLEAFNAMNPEYTLVSVGKKPETDASSKYRQQAAKWGGKILSTRYNGDFIIKITGQGRYTVNGENCPTLNRALAAYAASLYTPGPSANLFQ
jgi:beta-lactamase superfamily II metal-dependent hydrolase